MPITKQQTSTTVLDFIKRNDIAIAATLGTFSAAVAIYYLTICNREGNKRCSKSSQKDNNNKKQQQLQQHIINNTITNKSQKHYDQQTTQIKQSLQSLKSRRQKLVKLSKQFKIQYVEEEILTSLLSQQCVLNIFDVCVQLVDEEELNRIYENNRKARRTVFQHILLNAEVKYNRRQSIQSVKQSIYIQDNHQHHNQNHNQRDSLHNQQHNQRDSLPLNITSPRNILSIKNKLKQKSQISYPQALSFSEVYYRFVCTFEEDFKYLIEKTQKDFAVFLNIDFALITQSIDFHISKEDNEYFKQKIEEWTSFIKQSLKNKLYRYNEPIQPVQVCNILRSQIKYLKQKREKLMETIKKLGISNEDELDALPTFLECILQDEVYNKYRIEQEQMTVDMMHLSKNKQLQNLVEQFQLLTEKIVEEMYEQVNKENLHDEQSRDEI